MKCKCGLEIYETSTLIPGKERQWVHRSTGSAYCDRDRTQFAAPGPGAIVEIK